MRRYYVNKAEESSGVHEVHEWGVHCLKATPPHKRIDLGWHVECEDAIVAAQVFFPFGTIGSCEN